MGKYLINGNGCSELTKNVTEIIRNSGSYIKAANFLFEDPQIIEELKNALNRNVVVFIISNLKDADNQSKNKNIQQETNMNIPNLKELSKLGAHCRMLDDLHAKFIISESKSLLMSANFAPNSLSKNTETGIQIQDNERTELEYTFDKLFLNSDITRLSERNQQNEIYRQRKPLDKDVFAHFSSKLRLTVATNKKYNKVSNLINCKENGIYKTILDIINNAEKYLYIVTWHFKSLEKLPELKVALKDAIERGVSISLYSNSVTQVDSLEKSLIAIKELEKIGCESYGDDNNHSKCVISEKEGMIFTANIDGDSGLKSGFEVGCVFTEEQRQSAENHVQTLIKKNSNV